MEGVTDRNGTMCRTWDVSKGRGGRKTGQGDEEGRGLKS